jgi:hypothetical protein
VLGLLGKQRVGTRENVEEDLRELLFEPHALGDTRHSRAEPDRYRGPCKSTICSPWVDVSEPRLGGTR